MSQDKVKIFLKTNDNANLQETIKRALDQKYNGIMTPIIHPEYKREFLNQQLADKQRCFTRSPLVLDSHLWEYQVIPYMIPPNVGVNDEEIRMNYRLQLEQDLRFAFHLSFSGRMCIQLTNQDPEVLGGIVKAMLKEHELYSGQILIELPMVDTKRFGDVYCRDLPDDYVEEGEDMWVKWNKFYAATNYHSKIELALVMTSDLPSDEEVRRWIGEVVGMLIVPHNCFVSGKSNYPQLTGKHRQVFEKFIRYTKCAITVEAMGNNHNLDKMYSEMINFITPKFNCILDNQYEDSLRSPLQPLFHNLDSQTYEIFERDPAKYVLYQRAIEAAMMDKIKESEKETKKLRLMIVGAGRGPFIRCAVNACKNTGRKLKIIVVEKNPSAIVTISSLLKVMWPQEDIQLIMKDMRLLKLEEKVDIIVSELLGSFGDNELSPECLDGAQKHLKPDGVSIPYLSISYVRPVMTSKLFREIRARDDETIPEDSSMRQKLYTRCTQTNWLTYFTNVYYVDVESKEMFRFSHPNLEDSIDNSRNRKVSFTAKLNCVVNGFAGYFVAKLYKDIEISIHPETHTPGMASWYPIFFPTPQPIPLKANETFSFEMWRKVKPDVKVWYEWKTNDGIIANEGGEICPIFLRVQ